MPKKELKISNRKVPKISMPEEKAKEEHKKYCEALKKRKEKYLKVMKSSMYHLKKGRELIDIYVLMEKFSLNKNFEPRLAIARADVSYAYFERKDEGTGIFGIKKSYGDSVEWMKDNIIILPPNIFRFHWKREEGKPDDSWNIDKKLIMTKVPKVPIELLPEGDLKNYYILWEAKEWESIPEAKDPLLLKRISENLFVILGSWDVTPLEQSIIRGTE